MAYLVIIIGYSVAQIALGVWVARRLKGSSDFFVAGRSLRTGFAVRDVSGGEHRRGIDDRRDGARLPRRPGGDVVGRSAGIGSLILAFWVGPRIRHLAAEHDLKTAGDFLEWRYDRRVRATVSALLWIGTIAILGGQLVGIAWILNVVAGIPKVAGCALGAIVVTAYFGAGGLKSSAVVNVVQLSVKLLGFIVALPLVLKAVGGLDGLHAALPDPGMWNPWQHGASGWIYVFMLAPNFMISPALLQKVYGARDDRTVRLGVGLNGLALLA